VRVILRFVVPALVLAAVVARPAPALAGDPPPANGAATAAPAAAPPPAADDDLEFQPSQPDFTVINLPTTLRLPSHSLAFRVTHRFTRALNQGSFRESLGDAFGLDAGAQIGLELRFAPVRGAQIGVYRTNDKTVQFFASYNLLQQGERVPVGVSLVGDVEGTGNFKDSYSPAIGASISHTFGNHGAIYAVPMWTNNTNALPKDLVDSNNTFVVGLGARLRVAKGLYLAAETSPRAGGFKGGLNQGFSTYEKNRMLTAFAIEKQVGGHVFQVNVSNGFATTPANVARGTSPGKTNWYLGFNISRKFY
jgi:hypothetical protein